MIKICFWTWALESVLSFLNIQLRFRKNHLQILQRHNQMVGVGGPGAPHLFQFSRVGDGGLITMEIHWF